MVPTDLPANFSAAARGAGATAGDGDVASVVEDLVGRWRQPHRQYHTLQHLTDVLRLIDDHATSATDPDLVRLAAWYHDAVYDPRAGADTNERASADLATRTLAGLGLDPAAVTEVARLVRLTAGHSPRPGDRNGALLCDADLAVLARPVPEYERYAAAVRREYAHVAERSYRVGRAAILRHLLDLPTLYRTPELAARWEGAARANLYRELSSLDRPDAPAI